MAHPARVRADEEIGGGQGMEQFIKMAEFRDLNIAVALDEGLASPDETYSVFYGERLPWCMLSARCCVTCCLLLVAVSVFLSRSFHLVLCRVNIRARGPTGHGSRSLSTLPSRDWYVHPDALSLLALVICIWWLLC